MRRHYARRDGALETGERTSLKSVAPDVVADESTARMFVGVIFRGKGGKAHPDGEYG
jgi:hypothetical protein